MQFILWGFTGGYWLHDEQYLVCEDDSVLISMLRTPTITDVCDDAGMFSTLFVREWHEGGRAYSVSQNKGSPNKKKY